MAASSSKGGGGGSPANSSSSIYPASFIKRNLVPGADSYRQTLAALRDMDKDAVGQRTEYWRMEDALVEKAAKLLTSKDTSPEEIQAFLSSSDFTELSTTQHQINDVRTQTLRLATTAYDKVDDSIQALDWDIGMLEPQMAASAAEDNTLDPQILAIKRKEQRKAQRQEKQRAKEMASKKKKKVGKGGKDTFNDLGLVPSVGQGQGTPCAEEEVDPNEPLYCICQRISYGHMVGCDNEDCKNEWFHLECVGLLVNPVGTWLCPDCCVERGLIYQGAATAMPPPPATMAPAVAVAPMEEEEQQEQLVEESAEEAAAMVVVEEEGGGAEEGGGRLAEEGEEGKAAAAAAVVAEEAAETVAAAVDEGAREEEGGASTAAALEGEAVEGKALS